MNPLVPLPSVAQKTLEEKDVEKATLYYNIILNSDSVFEVSAAWGGIQKISSKFLISLTPSINTKVVKVVSGEFGIRSNFENSIVSNPRKWDTKKVIWNKIKIGDILTFKNYILNIVDFELQETLIEQRFWVDNINESVLIKKIILAKCLYKFDSEVNFCMLPIAFVLENNIVVNIAGGLDAVE